MLREETAPSGLAAAAEKAASESTEAEDGLMYVGIPMGSPQNDLKLSGGPRGRWIEIPSCIASFYNEGERWRIVQREMVAFSGIGLHFLFVACRGLSFAHIF